MKNKILTEQFIVECRRAKSYVIFECALFALLYLAIFLTLTLLQATYIIIAVNVIEVFLFVIYMLGVRKNMIGISRNFIAGHTGIVNTFDVIMPTNKVDNISVTSNFFENLFGATTIVVGVAGRFGGIKFRGMDKENAVKLVTVYQKAVRADLANRAKSNAE